MGIENVKQVILVLSGKGGVGKSSVAAQLALALAASGKAVGLLDTDICGPSIPRIFDAVHSKVIANEHGQWIPVRKEQLGKLVLFSLGFLMPKGNVDAAIIWRGPKKTAMIGQMLSKVAWGELDYLVVDTPPGTSDEHLALASELEARRMQGVTGAVLVTTPQLVALTDVEREIGFCRNVGLRMLGVVENMAGWTCGTCQHQVNLFSKGGGEQLAAKHNLQLLASLPVDSQLARLFDEGVKELKEYEACRSYALVLELVDEFLP